MASSNELNLYYVVLAPILEICKILASRGHVIEFATLAEREGLVTAYPFVSAVHIVGRAVTPSEDEELYLRYSRWDNRSNGGRRDFIEGKKFYDSFWPETFQGLKRVMEESRPDFIFGDYQVEAAKDVALEYCIPFAAMWPQMPWLMVSHKWIPGEPGTQLRCLTSEHASMYDRIFGQTYLLRYSPHLLDLFFWTRKMRREAGVKTMPAMKQKPDYLLFVNSFWGLEPAKDLPPLIQAVGPILSDEFPPLDAQQKQFLEKKTRVAYVAFGTHVILTFDKLEKIITGLWTAIQSGYIDGVIWAIRSTARRQLNFSKGDSISKYLNISANDLLANKHSSYLFLNFAPQRAILDHPSTVLFLTHAGASSGNEGLYHGVPMLSMAIYGDQIQESMRLVSAGVAISIDKHTFTADNISAHIGHILLDENGEFRRNVQRMQRIAHVASRKKYLASDLIEEHMYDWDLRFESSLQDKSKTERTINGGRGKTLSPMHLQTCDARISWIRASNF